VKPQPNLSPPTPPPRGTASFSDKTEKVLTAFLEPLDVIGNKIMGDLWRTVYLSIQDAIALACLIQIPSWIGKLIIGKEYNSFRVCLLEDDLGPNRYACFVIVAADFALWAVLGTRVITRCIQDFMELSKTQRGSNGQQP
jgi:hypothetical protein